MISPKNNDEEEGESTCGGTNWETYQENTNIKGKRGPKDVVIDEHGPRQIQMGQTNWFGKTFQHLVDYTMWGPIKRIPTNLGDRRWLYQRSSLWQKNLIDRVLIYDQLGISNEGVMDATNVIIQDVNIALKKIASPNAFVENE